MWTALIGPVVGAVRGYFKDKQEIKKAKVEAEKITIQAEAEVKKAEAVSKMKRAEAGELQDYELDRIAMKNMEKSWKDELVLIIFLIPAVMSFIPGYSYQVKAGFDALAQTPDWYQWILMGMIIVIYGLRGMASKVMDRFFKGK